MGQKDADGWGKPNRLYSTRHNDSRFTVRFPKIGTHKNVLATVMKTTVQEYPCTWLTGCYYPGLVCDHLQALLCDLTPTCLPLLRLVLCLPVWVIMSWPLVFRWMLTWYPCCTLLSKWKVSTNFQLMIHLQPSLQPIISQLTQLLFLLDIYPGNTFILSHKHFFLT